MATLLGGTEREDQRIGNGFNESCKICWDVFEAIETKLDPVSKFSRWLTGVLQCVEVPLAHRHAHTRCMLCSHGKDFKRKDAKYDPA